MHSLACPIDKVCNFVCAVSRHVFPKEIWGSNYNFNAFLSFLANYLKLGRYENKNISELVGQLRLSEINWLCISALNVGLEGNVCNEATKKKMMYRINHSLHTILLHVFLHWLFSSFINPLISTTFYVTEGEGLGGQVLYYLKSVWECLVCHVGMKQMESNFVKASNSFLSYFVVSIDFCYIDSNSSFQCL